MGEQQPGSKIDALYAPTYLSWTTSILMSLKNQGKAPKKQVVEPKRSKANSKTSKGAWALNSGLVVSNVLYNVAAFAPIPGLKYAAWAVATFVGTVEVCGGTSFDFCVKTSTSRKSRPTKKTFKSSLMMHRTLSSLYFAYKRNLKTRKSGHLLRLGIWLGISKRKNAEATCP